MVVIKIRRYAIIGFGCAGYNCLRALRKSGCVFPEVSGRIEEYLRSEGIGLYFGVKVEKAQLENGKGNLLLSDGSKLEKDIVIECIGTHANTQLVNPAEVRVSRAIVVGEDMKTTADGIYAAGDCWEENSND